MLGTLGLRWPAQVAGVAVRPEAYLWLRAGGYVCMGEKEARRNVRDLTQRDVICSILLLLVNARIVACTAV